MSVERCLCFNLGLAHRRAARLFEEALAPLGLTAAQGHFLSCLYEGDAQRSSDMARALGVDAGTLTPMIDRLERQGLIRRCPHPDDRRAIRICLTPAGRALEPAIGARLREASDRLRSRFGPGELETFLHALKRLAEPPSALAADTGEEDRPEMLPGGCGKEIPLETV